MWLILVEATARIIKKKQTVFNGDHCVPLRDNIFIAYVCRKILIYGALKNRNMAYQVY